MKDATLNLEALNNKIPNNYLWDGFWIDSYRRKTLNVSASFDRIYYRDIMIVYKGVTFFNLPYEWRDTVVAQPWMRLADAVIFSNHFPEVNIVDKHVIEWQLSDGNNNDNNTIERFYVVCEKVFVFKCEGKERDFLLTYKEPLRQETYNTKRFINRVPLLNKKL